MPGGLCFVLSLAFGMYTCLAGSGWQVPTSSSVRIFASCTGSLLPSAHALSRASADPYVLVALARQLIQYIRLVRSISDGKVFDLVDIVADRYLEPHPASPLEIWTFDRQIPSVPRGKRLRIPLTTRFRLHWSIDGWTTVNDKEATPTAVGIYYQDIPTESAAADKVSFTFFWIDQQRWEGADYTVRLT